jgi:hypothetical protein
MACSDLMILQCCDRAYHPAQAATIPDVHALLAFCTASALVALPACSAPARQCPRCHTGACCLLPPEHRQVNNSSRGVPSQSPSAEPPCSPPACLHPYAGPPRHRQAAAEGPQHLPRQPRHRRVRPHGPMRRPSQRHDRDSDDPGASERHGAGHAACPRLHGLRARLWLQPGGRNAGFRRHLARRWQGMDRTSI